MKKNIVAIAVLFCFPLLAYAAENDHMISSPSTRIMIVTLFRWILMIATPLLILATIVLGIKHFFKKDTKRNIPTSNIDIAMKLILPYSLFVGIFFLSQYPTDEYLCECFINDYGKLVANTITIVFLIGSVVTAYLMKKKNKEWKILYTLLTIISFLITFALTMIIGESFYR